jgi:hypothetical protein
VCCRALPATSLLGGLAFSGKRGWALCPAPVAVVSYISSNVASLTQT